MDLIDINIVSVLSKNDLNVKSDERKVLEKKNEKNNIKYDFTVTCCRLSRSMIVAKRRTSIVRFSYTSNRFVLFSKLFGSVFIHDK